MPAGLRLSPSERRRLVRGIVECLGRTRAPLRRLWLPALAVSTLALVVRLACVADVAPTLYRAAQPGVRMALRYTESAKSILAGDGLLYPRVTPDPADTALLARPPGYPAFVALVFRVVGPNYADVMTAQAILCALGAGIALLLVTRLAGHRAGLAAGILTALSPPLASGVSLVTPDALAAALGVAIAGLVWTARRGSPWRRTLLAAAAGALAGVGTWMRPNFLLLAPFLALAPPLLAGRHRRILRPSVALLVAGVAVVAPITVRNFRLFHAFVPVSANGGIVLWEGIADAGGERFGARSRDLDVAAEEAVRFGRPDYAKTWITPDGVARDRDRTRRSLSVIRENPWWYARSVIARGASVLASGLEAPLVEPKPPALAADSTVVAHPAVRFDAAFAGARPLWRALQTAGRWAAAPLALIGLLASSWIAPRRALLLALVPAYVVLLQAPMHFEPRFALPKDAFTPAFAGIGLALVATAVVRYWMYPRLFSSSSTSRSKALSAARPGGRRP
jgi:hypothetical protein